MGRGMVVVGMALLATGLGWSQAEGTAARTAADYRQMLDQLGIRELRPGVNGSDPKAAHPVNYDEARAEPFGPLPDALVMRDGRRVRTAAMWWKERRPELVEMFDREVYGRLPAKTPGVRWEVRRREMSREGEVGVVRKELEGHADNRLDPAITVTIALRLVTPAGATGRVPVVMEFDYAPEMYAAWSRRVGKPMPSAEELAWHGEVLARGWGYAELVATSVQADNGAGLREGIIGLCHQGRARRPDDWGALRAWAWGASRAMDYLETDAAVDATRVAIAGHSRLGKAALVTMAYEPRIAMAYVSSSGEGGAKPSRRAFGEELENLAAESEYHWMAGNFLRYAGPKQVRDLPVDANELIALAAPRPVFVGAGTTAGDGWADARGTFEAEVGADPVYRLLGGTGLGTKQFPAVGEAVTGGQLGFREHSQGHTPAPNWKTFLEFAAGFWSR